MSTNTAVRPAETVAMTEGMTVEFRADSPQFPANGGLQWVVIERDPTGSDEGEGRPWVKRGCVKIMRVEDVAKTPSRQRVRLACVDNLKIVAGVPDGFVPTRTPESIAADGPCPEMSTVALTSAFTRCMSVDPECARAYRDEIDRRGVAGDPFAAMWTATSMFRKRV